MPSARIAPLVLLLVFIRIGSLRPAFADLGAAGFRERRGGVGAGGELGRGGRGVVADFVVKIDAAEGEQDALDVCFPQRGAARGQ